MIRERAVEPVGQRRILNPRMLRADVIGDLILNDFMPSACAFSTSSRKVARSPKRSSTA